MASSRTMEPLGALARTGLWLLVAVGLGQMAVSILYTSVFDSAATIEEMRNLQSVLTGIRYVIWALGPLALGLVAIGARRQRLASLVWGAAALALATFGLGLARQAGWLSSVAPGLRTAFVIGDTLGDVLLPVWLSLWAWALGRRWLAAACWVVIVLATGRTALLLGRIPLTEGGGMIWIQIQSAVTAATAVFSGVVFAVCAVVGGRVARSPARPGNGANVVGDWLPAARGLAAFRAALFANAVLVALGIVLGIVAARAGSMGLAKISMTLLPLAGFVVTLVMLGGLVVYARLPSESRARGLARTAVGLFALCLPGQVIQVVVAHQILDGAWWKADAYGWLEPIVLGIGAAGAVVLLVSFARAGRAAGDEALGHRFARLAGALGIIVGAFVVLKLPPVFEALASATLLAVVAVALLVLLGLVVEYFVLVTRLVRRFRWLAGWGPDNDVEPAVDAGSVFSGP